MEEAIEDAMTLIFPDAYNSEIVSATTTQAYKGFQ